MSGLHPFPISDKSTARQDLLRVPWCGDVANRRQKPDWSRRRVQPARVHESGLLGPARGSYIYIYAYIYIYTCVSIYGTPHCGAYLPMYIYIYIYIYYITFYIDTYKEYMHIDVYKYLYVCMYVGMYVCLFYGPSTFANVKPAEYRQTFSRLPTPQKTCSTTSL